MKTNFLFIILLMFFIASCEKDSKTDDPGNPDTPGNLPPATVIADQTVAFDSVLRAIPKKYIYLARKNLHIAYQHTSHGTHVSRGMFGLPGFKAGDDTLFAITHNGNPVAGKLDFHDYALASFAPNGVDAVDLSVNETAFIQTTRNFLDNAANADVNVIMWSWCDITGHNVSVNYIPGMQTLINEYGVGGSKIGTGAGKRDNPVTFIFMTGHAFTNNVGTGKPKNQADLINNYCKSHNYYCLDYYGIDTHDMSGNYYDDASDDASSTKYGGNFFVNWQNAHTKKVHWYENRQSPGGTVDFGEHNSQHITSNRKAYAMWYILARIAGWDGESTN